jgi:hypothetical protein
MGEFINGYNPNIPNFANSLKSDKTKNDNLKSEELKEENSQETTQHVSKEVALDFLNQMGNISMAQINMISPAQSNRAEDVPELISKMFENFASEVVKGLTVPETIEDSMLSFEDLVDKATLILNNEFGGIAQFDNMSEEDKLALAAQFVLNMFSEN